MGMRGVRRDLGGAAVTLYNSQRDRLLGKPSIETRRCPFCGRPAEECPDGPRYKAIGNSMAVPVMRWIGERIAMCERGEIR